MRRHAPLAYPETAPRPYPISRVSSINNGYELLLMASDAPRIPYSESGRPAIARHIN